MPSESNWLYCEYWDMSHQCSSFCCSAVSQLSLLLGIRVVVFVLGKSLGPPIIVSSMLLVFFWPKGLRTDSIHRVTLVVLVGLAIVSVPTWIYVNNFGAHPSEPSVANKTDQLQ